MIIVYGEILIDMNCSSANNKIEYFVGGAPFNVAYAISKLDEEVLFVGNVGKDYFGKKIIEFAKNNGINPRFIYQTKENTTIAIVNNEANGERNFSFLRENSADYQFNDRSLVLIEDSFMVHLGSLMLSKERGFEFAKKVIMTAKRNNKKISFDVNFRQDIFRNMKQCLSRYQYVISKADIVKLSIDELFILTDKKDIDEGLKALANNNQYIFLTLGKDGSLMYHAGKKYYANSIEVNCIDTTGAGDAFYGTILALVSKRGFVDFFNDEEGIVNALRVANVQGALSTRKKGALSALASKGTLTKYLFYHRFNNCSD